MVEEKKGNVKVTVDVEINATLIEMINECMENIPHLVKMMIE